MESAQKPLLAGLADIVQFSAPIVYVGEEEASVRVGIMRLGSAHGAATVAYHTQDDSAKAGWQYTSASGEVRFEDGEDQKVIDIELLQDGQWHMTNEFKVHLVNPQGCELGKYLHFCRVKVLERNIFPTGKFAEEPGEDEWEEVQRLSGPRLFWAYVCLNSQQPGMRWRTVLTLIMDQLPNIVMLLQAWMAIYMVDVVFNVGDKSSVHKLIFSKTRLREASILALLFILPTAALQAWDCAKIKLDLKGHAVAFLRTNLVRRMLNYSEEAHAKVDLDRLEATIMEDVNLLAAGYIAILDTFGTLGAVATLIAFVVYSNPAVQWVIVAFPALVFALLSLRMCISVAAKDSIQAKTKLARLIGEMLRNYRLIVDFYQRPKINDMVSARVSCVQQAEVSDGIASKGIEYFAVWLGALCVGLLVVLQAPDLLGEGESGDRPVTLGAFLATIQVVRDLNRSLSSLQSLCFTLKGTLDPVRDFTFLFNLKTDLAVWRHIDHVRRELSLELGSIARRNSMNDHELGIRVPKYTVDVMQILMKDVAFHYARSEPVLKNTTLCVQQGKLVALRGHHSSGKRTVLQILGHSIFPVSGTVFVPGHLRILQVSDHNMLFETWSAWENLVFGMPEGGIDKDRVRKILEILDMTKTLKLVEDEMAGAEDSEVLEEVLRSTSFAPEELPVDSRSWHEILSSTERSKMCLARALIANPEVLILHKPFLNYESEAKPLVRSAILEHKNNRGIAMDFDKVDQRRPRTVFYSVVDPRDADIADVVWEIDSTTKRVSEVRSWPLGAAGNDYGLPLTKAASRLSRS